jgi:hypothetical protein
VAGSCEHGNEPSRSIKGGDFLHQPSDVIKGYGALAGCLKLTNSIEQNLIVSQPVKKFSTFYGTQGSLLCSQQSATGPYPVSGESGHILTLRFNIILPYTPSSVKWFVSFLFSDENGPCVVSFNPGEKSPRYPLGRRLGGPHSRSGSGGEERHSLPLPRIEPGHDPVRSLVTKLAELPLLLCLGERTQ